jgi:hypothetical protein
MPQGVISKFHFELTMALLSIDIDIIISRATCERMPAGDTAAGSAMTDSDRQVTPTIRQIPTDPESGQQSATPAELVKA